MYSASCSGRFRIFETYFVHSLASAPKCKNKLRTEFVVFRDFLNPVDQGTIFGTESFFDCFNFSEQVIDPFSVFLLVSLLDLLSEFLQIAIGLDFDFVAADD